MSDFTNLRLSLQDTIYSGVKDFIGLLYSSNKELRTYFGIVAWYDFDNRVVFISKGGETVIALDMHTTPRYRVERDLFDLVKQNIDQGYINICNETANDVRVVLDKLRSDGVDLISANICGMECIYTASTGMVTIVIGSETATVGTEIHDDIETITDFVLYNKYCLESSKDFTRKEQKRKVILDTLVESYNKNDPSTGANLLYSSFNSERSITVFLDEGHEIGFTTITKTGEKPIGFVMPGFNYVSLWTLANTLSEYD